ncbi:MAG TPA: SPW repeat protein [Jiangellaceae bacterium]
MTMPTPDIEQHPDVAIMRQRYDEIAETPMAQSADGLTFLAGTYLAMSPWVIGFTDHSALTISNLITGIAICLLALGFSAAYGHMHGMAWVAPILGAWAIASPWLVAGDTPENSAIVSNVIVGAVCVLCTLAMMSTGMRRTRA